MLENLVIIPPANYDPEFEKERRSALRYPFSGCLPHKIPDNHNHASRNCEKLINARRITSSIGFLSEKTLVSIAAGFTSQHRDDKELMDNLVLVRQKLLEESLENGDNSTVNLQHHTLRDPEAHKLYSKVKSYPPLLSLIRGIDRIYQTQLTQEYENIINMDSIYPSDHSVLRHVVEASLILGKLQFLNIDFFPGKVIPNVHLQHKQFDGVIIAHSPDQIEEKPFDLQAHLNCEKPWGLIQVKTVFNCINSTGKNKFKNPRRQHIQEIQNQLGEIWVGKDAKEFYPPNLIYFVYLRGAQETVVHQVVVNQEFLHSWRDGIGTKIDKGYYEGYDLDRANDLYSLLDYYGNLRRIPFRQNQPNETDSSVLNFSQGTLIDLDQSAQTVYKAKPVKTGKTKTKTKDTAIIQPPIITEA